MTTTIPTNVRQGIEDFGVATFEAFTSSKKRKYMEWITEAKTETTRDKRLAQAVEWMAEGKVRNWKYLNC